jgi:uncharacterized SAM-binding protein YcdF (DUF218 family)
MFILKSFLKVLILPPGIWMVLLALVFVLWKRHWARKFFLGAFLLILALHSGLVSRSLAYVLESRFPPLLDCRKAEPYDAIVVLSSGSIPATGLIPFPSIPVQTFRRLEEVLRLYRIARKPIVVSGGHVDPFSPSLDENKIACDYLVLWGVAREDVIPEPNSRDTFESALEVKKILNGKGWKRYLLVTSALHLPRSMMTFAAITPEPIAAPGDFTISKVAMSPFAFLPGEGAAHENVAVLNEYIGLIDYYLRLRTDVVP